MEQTTLLGITSIVVQLIFLEGILSIDNAAVLGAMVSVLPTDRPVPYPRILNFLHSITYRLLGTQQSAALKVGLLGAYFGRGLMLVLASWVIGNPFLKIVGAVYLIKLAFEHLGHAGGVDEGNFEESKPALSFWWIVVNVELADLAFSLDNVVAAVALSSQLWVVMLGVALGILTMRFAAGIFTWMIKREPVLASAAYIVVLNIGIEVLLGEFYHLHFESWEKFAISASTLILCVIYAHVPFLHFLDPVLRWLAEGMNRTNGLVSWILRPVLRLVQLIVVLFRYLGRLFLQPGKEMETGEADFSISYYPANSRGDKELEAERKQVII